MKKLKLTEILTKLVKEDIHITKSTFEFYQKLGLLPKPMEKQKGKGGRGVYGLYDPSVVDLIKTIHRHTKEQGRTLYDFMKVVNGFVIEKYRAVLNEWGFSDYTLSELKGMPPDKVKACDEQIVREATKFIAKDHKKKTGKDINPEVLSSLQQSYMNDALYEEKILQDLKWWSTSDVIEIRALTYIEQYAFDLLNGLITASIIVADEIKDDSDRDSPLFSVIKKIYKKIYDIEVLRAKIEIRICEVREAVLLNKLSHAGDRGKG